MFNNAQIESLVTKIIVALIGGFLAKYGLNSDETTEVCAWLAGGVLLVAAAWFGHWFHSTTPSTSGSGIGTKASVVAGAILLLGTSARAQITNLPSMTTFTNYNVHISAGHSFNKNYWMIRPEIQYNAANNLGVVLGGAAIGTWNTHSLYIVTGGVEVHAAIQPFSWTGVPGLDSFWCEPYDENLICNPYHSSSAVGYLNVSGIGIDLYNTGSFAINLTGEFVVLTGTGEFDTDYGLGSIEITHNWPEPGAIAFKYGMERFADKIRHTLEFRPNYAY